jgi:hypothetical protein
MLRPPAPIPATGWLPASFPLFMVVTLLHALPRPDARYPTSGRSRIHHVLQMIRDLAPRDAFEAELVLQLIITSMRGPLLYGLAAAHEGDLKAHLRYQRLALAVERTAGAIETRLDRRRKARELDGPAVETGAPWDYEMAELEAIWRTGMELEAGDAAAAVEGRDGGNLSSAGEGVAVAGEAVTAPVSRQQRRALERMQQKLARRAAVKMAVEARGLARAA